MALLLGYGKSKIPGNQTLELNAYVIVEMPNGKEETQVLVYNKPIEVKVNPDEMPTTGDKITSMLESPYMKALGLLAGLLAFMALFFKEDIPASPA